MRCKDCNPFYARTQGLDSQEGGGLFRADIPRFGAGDQSQVFTDKPKPEQLLLHPLDIQPPRIVRMVILDLRDILAAFLKRSTGSDPECGEEAPGRTAGIDGRSGGLSCFCKEERADGIMKKGRESI